MTTDADVLADFLRTDVQDYRPRIIEIREALKEKGHAVFAGNAFELTLSKTQAVIRHAQAKHPPAVLALADFEAAFTAWVAGQSKV